MTSHVSFTGFCLIGKGQEYSYAVVPVSEVKWKERKFLSRVQLFEAPYSPWNSPGQNTGVSSGSLLQEIFLTQGSNPDLLHCRQILYPLSHKGSPTILEWVAYPFSSGSSWPSNRIRVSCIAGRFFTNWAIRDAPVPVGKRHLLCRCFLDFIVILLFYQEPRTPVRVVRRKAGCPVKFKFQMSNK